MKRILSYLLLVVLVFSLLPILTSCAPKTNEKITLIARDGDWGSISFHNAVVNVIIEQAFDSYEVELQESSTLIGIEKIRSGDFDFIMECWLEIYSEFLADIETGVIVDYGVILRDVRQGLFVPTYMVDGDPVRNIEAITPGLTNVNQLKEYYEAFQINGEKALFHGGSMNWNSGEIMWNKFNYLGLQNYYEFVTSEDEEELFASLIEAYQNGLPWIGYAFEPSWVLGEAKLTKLQEEPYDVIGFEQGKTEFASQNAIMIGSRNLKQKAPEVAEFLKQFYIGKETVSEVLAYARESGKDFDEVAKWFLLNNEEMVRGWLPEKNANQLFQYLNQ